MKLSIVLLITILISIYFTSGNKTFINNSNEIKFEINSNLIVKEATNFENTTKNSSIGDSTLQAIISYCKPYCNSSHNKFSEDDPEETRSSSIIEEIPRVKQVFNRIENPFGSQFNQFPINSHSDYEGRLTDSFFKYVIRDKNYDRNEVPWIGERGSEPVKIHISAFLRYVIQD